MSASSYNHHHYECFTQTINAKNRSENVRHKKSRHTEKVKEQKKNLTATTKTNGKQQSKYMYCVHIVCPKQCITRY